NSLTPVQRRQIAGGTAPATILTSSQWTQLAEAMQCMTLLSTMNSAQIYACFRGFDPARTRVTEEIAFFPGVGSRASGAHLSVAESQYLLYRLRLDWGD